MKKKKIKAKYTLIFVIAIVVISLIAVGLIISSPYEGCNINWHTYLPVTEMFIEHSSEREEKVTHIMIHFMSNVSANSQNPFDINDNHAILERYNVSAHYIIDREGNIYLLVPEYRAAWHAGNGYLEGFPHLENNFNQFSIGIELLAIGTREEMAQLITPGQFNQIPSEHIGFTDAQMDTLNNLINDILERHEGILPNRLHIVGHNEYSESRPDPGSLFNWNALDFMEVR
ncbi:MAG: N-acetylmuramoyl-L-alanine amidase [Oscillospiraceae bacterium]|nr:N-acetylmuramoyl-L-alanine amidase [Oscillospiraceae bacterium]